MAALLAKVALLEAWPKIDNGAMVTLQAVATAIYGLPWKAALDSSQKLAGSLGWLLVTGLRALDQDFVPLQSKVRDLEKEVGDLRDARVITQELITTQAEWCYELQNNVERLAAPIVGKQRDAYE